MSSQKLVIVSCLVILLQLLQPVTPLEKPFVGRERAPSKSNTGLSSEESGEYTAQASEELGSDDDDDEDGNINMKTILRRRDAITRADNEKRAAQKAEAQKAEANKLPQESQESEESAAHNRESSLKNRKIKRKTSFKDNLRISKGFKKSSDKKPVKPVKNHSPAEGVYFRGESAHPSQVTSQLHADDDDALKTDTNRHPYDPVAPLKPFVGRERASFKSNTELSSEESGENTAQASEEVDSDDDNDEDGNINMKTIRRRMAAITRADDEKRAAKKKAVALKAEANKPPQESTANNRVTSLKNRRGNRRVSFKDDVEYLQAPKESSGRKEPDEGITGMGTRNSANRGAQETGSKPNEDRPSRVYFSPKEGNERPLESSLTFKEEEQRMKPASHINKALLINKLIRKPLQKFNSFKNKRYRDRGLF